MKYYKPTHCLLYKHHGYKWWLWNIYNDRWDELVMSSLHANRKKETKGYEVTKEEALAFMANSKKLKIEHAQIAFSRNRNMSK